MIFYSHTFITVCLDYYDTSQLWNYQKNFAFADFFSSQIFFHTKFIVEFSNKSIHIFGDLDQKTKWFQKNLRNADCFFIPPNNTLKEEKTRIAILSIWHWMPNILSKNTNLIFSQFHIASSIKKHVDFFSVMNILVSIFESVILYSFIDRNFTPFVAFWNKNFEIGIFLKTFVFDILFRFLGHTPWDK